jgi:4-amino-4-deoxy-L-arabinose transferase-like glycosyltransferase
MVAAGRVIRLGYFDHPPASWWLAWAAERLAGSEAAWVVRLPFILLFALTTLAMYRLGRHLYGERAGVCAVVALNLSPVFGVTSATWVLPDGPLLCALTGAALCLAKALEGRRATLWWLAAGLCLGLALFSKYSAALTAFGALVLLLTSPRHRAWLLRPQPYLAAAVAGLVFLPVLVWNIEHGWASFAFQGGRAAAGARLYPWGPLTVLGGEALFVLPWIWLPMLLLALRVLQRGPRVTADWFCLCLAAPPILLFAAIAAWSGQRVLFHWADPGYLMLFPLLGDWIARTLPSGQWHLRRVLWGTAGLLTVCIALLVSDVRWNWLPPIRGGDPVVDAVAWTSVREQLAARGLPAPGMMVAGVRWQDCGKLDYAWGGAVPVVCLTADARQYAVDGENTAPPGTDVLIVGPRLAPDGIAAALGKRFRTITALPPATVLHDGSPALVVQVYRGEGYLPSPAAESSPVSAPPAPAQDPGR